MPSLDHDQPFRRLEHGYKEPGDKLQLEDLQQAAGFRGGELLAESWDGDMHAGLEWRCCQRHDFKMSPHAVLKGGHWCLDCIAPPWNYQVLSEKNPFAAQVLKN
jgi:hypothetical protein